MGMTVMGGLVTGRGKEPIRKNFKRQTKTPSHGLVSSSHMRKVISAGEWQPWTVAVSLLLGHISVA